MNGVPLLVLCCSVLSTGRAETTLVTSSLLQLQSEALKVSHEQGQPPDASKVLTNLEDDWYSLSNYVRSVLQGSIYSGFALFLIYILFRAQQRQLEARDLCQAKLHDPSLRTKGCVKKQKRQISEQPDHVVTGVIDFESGQTKFITFLRDYDLDGIFQHQFNEAWNLQSPLLLVSLTGSFDQGACDINKFEPESFSSNLSQALRASGAWVACRGDESPSTLLLEKAPPVPLISIMPISCLSQSWASLVASDDGGLISVSTPKDCTETCMLESFTHCVFANTDVSSVQNAFVNQTKAVGHAAQVAILVGGDFDHLKSIASQLETKHSMLVVCDGTGGASNVLSEAVRMLSLRNEISQTDISSLVETHMKLNVTKEDLELLIKTACSGKVYVSDNVDSLARTLWTAVRKDTIKQSTDKADFTPEDVKTLENLFKLSVLASKHLNDEPHDDMCQLMHRLKGDAFFPWLLNSFVGDGFEHDSKLCIATSIKWIVENKSDLLETIDVKAELGPVAWNGLPQQRHSEGPEAIMLWCIEHQATQNTVLEVWMHMKDSIPALLVMAHAYRELASTFPHSTYEGGLAREAACKAAHDAEVLAVALVEDIVDKLRTSPTDLLFRPARRWGDFTTFQLASMLECTTFTSTQLFRSVVDEYWLTPYPFHQDKEELPSEYATLTGIITLVLRPDLRKLTLAELLEVPLVKAYTYGATRVMFAIFYAYLLLSDQIAQARSVYSVILFAWTTGFIMIEVLQYQKDGSKAYLSSHVNWLDATYLSILTACIFVSWVFEAGSDARTKRIVQVCLSFNFVPVALRTLTVFKLSPFLGGLLWQLYYLAKDCITFFFLLSLFYLTMAVTLDPILFSSWEAQEHQGLFWPYYVIGGSVNSNAQTAANALPSPLSNISSTMLYGTIVVSNVLLINLLIAIMSNTYGTNASRTAENWATAMIETVLEFDDLPALPPPFNLWPLLGDALWLPRVISNPLDISDMEWDVGRPSTWRRKDMIAAKQRVRESMLQAQT